MYCCHIYVIMLESLFADLPFYEIISKTAKDIFKFNSEKQYSNTN